MLIVLSPAKTLDFSAAELTSHSQPAALDEAQRLIKTLRNKPLKDLREMMDISAPLARLNRDRYQAFEQPFSLDNAKQALLAFKGDTYTDVGLDGFGEEDYAFAQQHLRILSGLYGALRPLDLIQPYRLEMGTRLKTRRGKTLYDFWGDRITKQLNATLAEAEPQADGKPVLLNLASNEYFSAIRPKKLKARIVTARFEDLKNGKHKIISFFAKRARGAMAGWAIRNRVTEVEGLHAFNLRGYAYDAPASSDDELNLPARPRGSPGLRVRRPFQPCEGPVDRAAARRPSQPRPQLRSPARARASGDAASSSAPLGPYARW